MPMVGVCPSPRPQCGAKLVLPGRHTDGASLAKLMREEGVTIAVGVQTVWLGVLDHLDAAGGELPDLKRVIIGGSKCPDALDHGAWKSVLGVRVQTSWGMTELSPLGHHRAARHGVVRARRASGRPPMGLDLKLTDADGVTLAQQRGVVGHLKVKGASVVDRYFKAETDALDAEGYFDTGDLASIDDDGNLTICGRSKDLIKSGRRVDQSRPKSRTSSAVTRRGSCRRHRTGSDEKWGERPVLIVEPRNGHVLDAQALLDPCAAMSPTGGFPTR